MTTVCVIVSDDHLALGPAATPEDLDLYCSNLAALLARVHRCDVEVQPALVQRSRVDRRRSDASDDLCDSVEEYVRDLEASDGWVALLDEVQS